MLIRHIAMSALLLTGSSVLIAQTRPDHPEAAPGGNPPRADRPPMGTAEDPRPMRGQGGGFNNRGPGDRAGENIDPLKKEITASDEEWKVIGPLVRKVVAARRTAESGLIMDPGNGPGGLFRNMMGFRGPPARNSFSGPGAVAGRAGPSPEGERRPPEAREGNPEGAPPPGRDGPPREGAGIRDGQGPRPDGAGPPQVAGGPGGPGGPPPGGPGGPGGPGAGGPVGGPRGLGQNAVTLAIADLQTLVADSKATPEQIKEKVQLVRAAREKARSALAEAQRELVALLTPDQEARLVALGVID